ncbi:DUF4258 domain-containing protein [Clostridium sp.]|uniref:DUF4258 domain-containing protein n=1 Tax=Clostridium sp. TaxID=1506 RepID=UPI0025B9A575|nr:DUF4258 domain-containing protein [Clostridium sp.]
MKEERVKYEELKEEEKINIEKQLEEHLKNNTKLKISVHAVQRMGQRGIGFKHVKNLIKTKDYFIDSITKADNNICISIISNTPLRNKLHLKLVLCLTNYMIVTAMVKKVKEGDGNNEYERI